MLCAMCYVLYAICYVLCAICYMRYVLCAPNSNPSASVPIKHWENNTENGLPPESDLSSQKVKWSKLLPFCLSATLEFCDPSKLSRWRKLISLQLSPTLHLIFNFPFDFQITTFQHSTFTTFNFPYDLRKKRAQYTDMFQANLRLRSISILDENMIIGGGSSQLVRTSC